MAKSQVINARLHPAQRFEAEALQIYNTLLGEGFTTREIVTDALLRLSGLTPEMYRQRGERTGTIEEALYGIREELAALREEQAEQMHTLLRKLKAADPEGFRAFAEETAEQDDLELDDAFIRNAQKAMRRTYQQGRD